MSDEFVWISLKVYLCTPLLGLQVLGSGSLGGNTILNFSLRHCVLEFSGVFWITTIYPLLCKVGLEVMAGPHFRLRPQLIGPLSGNTRLSLARGIYHLWGHFIGTSRILLRQSLFYSQPWGHKLCFCIFKCFKSPSFSSMRGVQDWFWASEIWVRDPVCYPGPARAVSPGRGVLATSQHLTYLSTLSTFSES